MTEWKKDSKPCKEDSPIIGCGMTYTGDSFYCAVLYWIDGWDGEGFYDHSEEYGMKLDEIDVWKHFKTPQA